MRAPALALRKERRRKPAETGVEELMALDLLSIPGHLLRRCDQIALALFAQQVGSDGLTPGQFALLLTVLRRPGLTQVEVAGLTGIDGAPSPR